MQKFLLNAKNVFTLVFLSVSISILYFSGYSERVYPEQYSIPFEHILRQPDHITCGPTCVTMILKEYRKDVTIDQVKIETNTVWFNYNNKDIGTTPPEFISSALSYFGVESSEHCGNLSVLKHYVAQGRLCIVLVRTGEYLFHYVIVRGYTDKYISIVDPCGSMYDILTVDFENCWSWERDMDGIPRGTLMVSLLGKLEIYPYTFICPDFSHRTP